MKINVKFFASYRELIGIDKEEYYLERGDQLKLLKKKVVSAHPSLKDVKDPILTSLNEKLIDEEEIELKDGDEVAFFPSFSGG